MSISLTILGCGAAAPTVSAQPSGQVLDVHGQLILLDCGEGTQVQLRLRKIRFTQISLICISHLHGDHFFGLPGLLSTFHLLNREKPLTLIGPPGLEVLIRTILKATKTWTCYPLHFLEVPLADGSLVMKNEAFSVFAFPLEHSIETIGFRIEEKQGLRKINAVAVENAQIPRCDLRPLQLGRDIQDAKGTWIPNAQLTFDPKPVIKYAYASDTAFCPAIVPHICGVDWLYHESTFADSHASLALKTKHSTARDAGKIAALANVKHLLLGHFSIRYADRTVLLREAEEEFSSVQLAHDGLVIRME